MKADKKVVESIAVAALAIALSITAVTGNRVGAEDINTAAKTQLDTNGIAGVAVVINEYEMEMADALDGFVSVEREDVGMVAASAEDVTMEEPEMVSIENESEPVSEEEKEWQDKLMAKVDDFLYVRAKADADSEIVGKMYKGDRAVIKGEGDDWIKISSGNVKGYVKNEYCVTGQEAYQYALANCRTVAKVNSDGLRVRKAPNTDAEVIQAVASGEKFTVDTEAKTKDGWVAVKVASNTYYVSEEHVTVSLKTGKAITIEEEAAAIKAEEERKAEEAHKAEEARKAAAADTSSSSSSGQTASSGSSQGTSLAATADEETLLAALIQCEAGGQSMECMTAVGAVVVNRMRSGSFPNSMHGVIYQRGQFGPASSGRLESRLATGPSSSARQAARAALNGGDPTGGAKYFKLASSGHAGVVIGPIVFY